MDVIQERETRADGEDTTYGSPFAFMANQIEEKRWRLYNMLFGTVLGLLMGGILFAIPSEILGDSVRLITAFAIGTLPMRLLEARAERSMKTGRNCMAIAFSGCMAAFAGYLLFR